MEVVAYHLRQLSKVWLKLSAGEIFRYTNSGIWRLSY
jgi:hypothetical protein